MPNLAPWTKVLGRGDIIEVRFGPRVGHISSKVKNPGRFQIRFQFILTPMLGQSDPKHTRGKYSLILLGNIDLGEHRSGLGNIDLRERT